MLNHLNFPHSLCPYRRDDRSMFKYPLFKHVAQYWNSVLILPYEVIHLLVSSSLYAGWVGSKWGARNISPTSYQQAAHHGTAVAIGVSQANQRCCETQYANEERLYKSRRPPVFVSHFKLNSEQRTPRIHTNSHTMSKPAYKVGEWQNTATAFDSQVEYCVVFVCILLSVGFKCVTPGQCYNVTKDNRRHVLWCPFLGTFLSILQNSEEKWID